MAVTGVFDAMLETLAGAVERDASADMIGSTVVRAHHCAAGIKKELGHAEALGRSRGGSMTKPYARGDACGRPLAFVLTPGQARDIQGFRPLMRMVNDRIDALLADRGYDADTIRGELADAGIGTVIPAKANRRNPAPHNRAKYHWRNRVKRLSGKLKNWRRIAKRYDKTAESYLAFVNLASALLWHPFAA